MRALVVLLLLACPIPAHARDLSSFYAIYGFNNPALRGGQYVLALTPRYVRSPVEYTSASGSTLGAGSASVNGSGQSGPTDSYVQVALTSFYGLTDKTTLNLQLSYSPTQSALDGSGSSWGQAMSGGSAQTWSTIDAYSQRGDNVAGSMTLSYRPRQNVELSLGGYYGRIRSTSATTSAGPMTTPIGSYLQSRSNWSSGTSSALDLWASFVLIGN